MREKIEQLIEELNKAASDGEKIAKRGSPVTSMYEDHAIGEVAKEQRRISARLTEILAMAGIQVRRR